MRGRAGPFVCSTAARWLPRTLAGSLLAAALVVSMRIDPQGISAFSRPFRVALVLVAAAAALWIVRRGAEVRLRVWLGDDRIEFRHGNHGLVLPFAEIERIDFASAFGPSRHWLSALLLTDRAGRGWRIPALIADGGTLVREILRRAGRSDLDAWAAERDVEARMSRSRQLQLVGYSVAAAALTAALVYGGRA